MKNSTRYLLSHLATRLGIAAILTPPCSLHPAGMRNAARAKNAPPPPAFPAFIWRPRKVFLPQRVWEDGDALGKAFLK